MRGVGRWLVYGRLRAWLGVTLEMPSLLRGFLWAIGPLVGVFLSQSGYLYRCD
jgi:hypothetical protein